MAGDESQNPIVQKVDALLARKGLTRARASKMANLSVDYLRKLAENPTRTGNVGKLAQLAKVLDVPLTELMGEGEAEEMQSPARPASGATREVRVASVRDFGRLSKDLPVLGTVAGSAVNGAFQFTPDVVDYVRRPPALLGVSEAYALYVENESMTPKYNPGDLVFVHPRRPVRRGDDVVLQIKPSPHSEIESFIKTFSARTSDFVVVQQLNPVATLQFRRETVISVHKVMTMNDLFGV